MDVDEIADELYGLLPEEFTAARNARAKQARAAGDRGAAGRIAALRKPTVAAWAANQLVRARRDEVEVLLDLGAELRAGMVGLSGDELRELTKRRHALVAALVRSGEELAAATGRRLGPAAVDGLRSTLEATLADQGSADELRAGRLAETLAVTGFGLGFGVPAADPVGAEPSEGATVADLEAHRRRKEAAVEAAREAVAAAEQAHADATADAAVAAERASTAERAAAAAAKAVRALEADLARAQEEAARRDRKAAKRGEQRDAADERVEEAADDLRDARERLAGLTGGDR